MALGFSLFYALLVGFSEMFVFVVCDIMKLQYNFSFKPGNLFIYSLLLNMISCIVYCGITCHTQPFFNSKYNDNIYILHWAVLRSEEQTFKNHICGLHGAVQKQHE